MCSKLSLLLNKDKYDFRKMMLNQHQCLEFCEENHLFSRLYEWNCASCFCDSKWKINTSHSNCKNIASHFLKIGIHYSEGNDGINQNLNIYFVVKGPLIMSSLYFQLVSHISTWDFETHRHRHPNVFIITKNGNNKRSKIVDICFTVT